MYLIRKIKLILELMISISNNIKGLKLLNGIKCVLLFR